MSDRDYRSHDEPGEDCARTRTISNKINCAHLLRRSPKIGPLFHNAAACFSEEHLNVVPRKSPTRIRFRPNPGRSFDGFLDRFSAKGKGASAVHDAMYISFTECSVS